MTQKKYQTGLVMSGGAVRGFAHIGVLKALQERGFEPDVVSGVSAGSIVGAFYCDGYAPEEIYEIFTQKKLLNFVKFGLPKAGFLEMKGLKEVLENNLRTKSMENLKKPFWISVTNYCTGETEYFNKGSLVDAVIASSSIPAVFKPYKIGDNYYIDGGITDNFPIKPIKDHTEQLIGAFVNPVNVVTEPMKILQTVLRTFQLSVSSEIKEKRKRMEVFIEPKSLKKYGLFDVNSGREIFEMGYAETHNMFDKKYGEGKSFALR